MTVSTQRLPRELILASAGSGKTFRISSRIIALLAAGEPPATIFASTFTRKAAGEILERVLIRLAAAALDPSAAAELAKHATLDDDAPPPADPAFWLEVLQRTVRQLHRVDVGTLDAFFVRALGLFAHDLGLPPGWGIADEPVAERLRADALQDVLAAVDDGARIELVRGLAAGSTRRAVLDALVREVDGIASVQHALASDAVGWGALRGAVEARPADLEDRCRHLAERIRAVPGPETRNGGPHGGWRTALDDIADGVEGRDWPPVIRCGLFCTSIDDPAPTYYRYPVPPEVLTLMREVLVLARTDLAPEYTARAEAMGRLAALYTDAFDRQLRDEGALRFDDVTRLLGGPAPLAGRPDLFYRLDGRTRHVLLDEFQDTSLLQWAALEPLADLLLGDPEGADAVEGGEAGEGVEGRAAVIVADPKQSIYGWRGAAPVVVDHVAGRYRLDEEVLARSWRSSQVVLDAVNRIFQDIEQRAALTVDPMDARVARDWARTFAPHVAQKELPGHVRLLVGPRDPGRGSQKPLLCRYAAGVIRDLREAAPGRSIGVLTRTNETVARLMFELRELDVPASEEGGGSLTDSAATASVLALLRLADHPGDSLAAYHVARTPLGPAVGLTDPTSRRAVDRTAHRLRRQLMDQGYGRTLDRVARAVDGACTPRERARLGQLVELAFRWDERATLRVDDFVRAAMAERVEVPVRSEVRVMTVHQAKGLEFDIVVLPELEASLVKGGGGRKPLAYRPEGVGPVTHVFPPMSEAERRVFGHIQELRQAREQDRGAAVRDALSTLYVAVSRARYALHMIIAADGDKGPGSARSHASVVREALAGPPSAERPACAGAVLFEAGDPDWHRSAPEAEAPAEPPAAVTTGPIALRPAPRRTRMLARRKPSAEARASIDLQFVLASGSSRSAMDHGTVAHAWLERMAWIEDGLPEPVALRAVAREVAPHMPDDAVTAAAARLADQLAAPAVQAVLSRARYPHGAIAETERPFLLREDDVLLEGIIDRLVLVREGGRVVAAEVIDYKTDAVTEADVDERAAHYVPQVHTYRRAVASMYGVQFSAVKGTLVFLQPGRTFDV
jgi:ATP-dependent helicase/nuclease subunit A